MPLGLTNAEKAYLNAYNSGLAKRARASRPLATNYPNLGVNRIQSLKFRNYIRKRHNLSSLPLNSSEREYLNAYLKTKMLDDFFAQAVQKNERNVNKLSNARNVATSRLKTAVNNLERVGTYGTIPPRTNYRIISHPGIKQLAQRIENTARERRRNQAARMIQRIERGRASRRRTAFAHTAFGRGVPNDLLKRIHRFLARAH